MPTKNQPHPLLDNSANVPEAHNAFADFQKAYQKPLKNDENTQRFWHIFGNSTFLARFAIKHPDSLDNYQKSPFTKAEKPAAKFLQEVQEKTQNTDEKSFWAALKKYKYQEFLRLTIKELLAEDPSAIYRELSFLAQAAVSVSSQHVVQKRAQEKNISLASLGDHALIAMGKLGGQELNYSSDIDLIGIFENNQDLGPQHTQEFLGKAYAELAKKLTTADENGFLFRVDWELRPEGKAGVLANSLKGMENYYTVYGQEWERQAYIKARVLSQETQVGDTLLKLLTPFVYRKTLDEKTIKNIWNMKAKIHAHLKKSSQQGLNIKLDKGGIRDIEFFTQGFQLLHGGKIPELRLPNTVAALEALAKHKLITPQIQKTLTQSYLFLRRVESCLQMETEAQTHTVKNNKDHKTRVAKRLALTREPQEALDKFEESLATVRGSVAKIFEEHYGG